MIKYRPSTSAELTAGKQITNPNDFFKELFGDEDRYRLTKGLYDKYQDVQGDIDQALGSEMPVMEEYGFASMYLLDAS